VHALVLDATTFTLTERPTPSPGAHEVLVDVAATGLNAADLLQRRGLYPAPAGWPQDIPGLELAGTVAAVGEYVDASLIGSRVCAIVGGGAFASQALVPAAHLIPVPEAASDVEAGGFAEAFLTAFDALVVQADLRAGERVLISGAAGGVGTAAVQIARLLGAHVIAVSRHSEHEPTLRALGADEVITPEAVADLAPVQVLLELVGAANLERAQHRLAPFARVVIIGIGGGATAQLNLLSLMGTRARLTGSTLRARSHDEKAGLCALVREQLLPAWADGTLRVPVATTFDVAAVDEAFDFFARPGKLGKVILTYGSLA